MTERSLPWPGTATGDKGPYTADQWRLPFEVLERSKGSNIGVIGGILNSLRPSSPANDQISAATGRALADGTPYESDAVVTKTMSTPAVGTTGKQLVLQKDWTAQTVRLAVISSADGTAAIPALTQTDGVTWENPICSFTHATDGVIAAGTDLREFTNPAVLPFLIDGGGLAIATGEHGHQKVPFDFEVVGWEVLPDQSGSILVDIFVDSYANYPPTNADSICGTDEPEVVATTKAQNLNVAFGGQWTLKLTKDQIAAYNVDSATTIERATILIIGAGG